MRLIKNLYKLLVIDVDGTLLGKNGTISAEDSEALAKARHSGIQVSLSSGRTVRACRHILSQLSLDGYHIFFDGGLVSNPALGQEVYVEPIEPEVVREATRYAHLNDIPLELYSITDYFAEKETWSTEIRRRFFGIEPVIVDFAKLWNKERIIKGGITCSSPQEVAKAKEFGLQFSDNLDFSWATSPSYPSMNFINVVVHGVTKGKALEVLASHLGIALTEVMAIGDGTNDIPLLSLAGLAIAMDNASDEVKAVANYITRDADHNGVAVAIERFLL